MLKQIRLLSTVLALSAGSLCAAGHPEPCNWEVSADFLYLLPTLDDTFFVINAGATSAFPAGKREANDLHFHPGFRVGAAVGVDEGRDFQVAYSRLEQTKDRTVTSGGGLYATMGLPALEPEFQNYAGSASSNIHLLYQRVDGLIAQQGFVYGDAQLFFNFGLEYAYLRLNEDITYVNTDGDIGLVDRHQKHWGLGPQAGIEVDYSFADTWLGDLSLNVRTSGSLLTSRRENDDYHVGADATLVDTNDDNVWRVIPAFHAQFGLAWDFCLPCGEANLEIGYEYHTYLRGFSRAIYPTLASGSSFNHYHNFDLQGLYVSASVGF